TRKRRCACRPATRPSASRASGSCRSGCRWPDTTPRWRGSPGSRRSGDNRAMDTPLPESLRQRLADGLASLGLDAALSAPLLDYLALLLRWNRTYNLTAIRDPDEMVTRHLLDSLAMQPFVRPGALADLGTGPGLPGIPLAIARPDVQVTLVESNGKKARFLREAVRQLKLGNARVVESR